MSWRISQIIAIIVFLASLIQLYRDPNIGFLIVAFGSFASLMTWLKGEIVIAAEKLNDPSMEVVSESINALKNIANNNKSLYHKINNFPARWELRRAMRFHKNPEVNKKAASALMEIGDNKSLKTLLSYLPNREFAFSIAKVKVLDNKARNLIKNKIINLFENFEETNDWELSVSNLVNCLLRNSDKISWEDILREIFISSDDGEIDMDPYLKNKYFKK